MRITILDTDNSLQMQPLRSLAVETIELLDLRSRLQFFSDRETIQECKRRIFVKFPVSGACRFLGSGDFHHLTLAILEEIYCPFVLLVFDNHLDCSYPYPKYACGNWLYHAAALPGCQKIIHVGSTEKYGLLRKLLGLRPLFRLQKLRLLPIDSNKDEQVFDAFLSARDEIVKTGLPVYVSIDKDALPAKDAPSDWDNGVLSLGSLRQMLGMVQERLEILGADITGEYGAYYNYPGYPLKRLVARWDHPTARHGLSAGDIHERQYSTNVALLEAMTKIS